MATIVSNVKAAFSHGESERKAEYFFDHSGHLTRKNLPNFLRTNIIFVVALVQCKCTLKRT